MKTRTQFTKYKETTNLWKPILSSKVVDPFTRALASPFIGRRRDFYIPRITSNLRNIPSVNMYMNVFYISWFTGLISYIHKPAISSHFKPWLLSWRLWLDSFLIPNLLFMKITAHCNSRIKTSPDSRTSQIPDFKTSQFLIPELRRFLIPELRGFQPPWNKQQIRTYELDSAIIFAYHLKAWKTLETHQDFFMNVSLSRNWTFYLKGDSRIYLTNFGKSDVSRV
jgi:hypothetical protein